jgi:hypothetical protein
MNEAALDTMASSAQDSLAAVMSPPIDGPLWTWVVPIALFGIAFMATFMLYRHFAGKKSG